ncbi:galactokinase [Rathayibacter toxicus]|uniref:Galactokinase n=1 Tax=Rathayibacter toxicus TaxID=145458 RepID=A0A0U1PUC2_9MICO|nr:galactokinase [Rathayibacter toxicus]ALS56916.1 galactokinase [Rathayibacter toxicus]KKM46249.1 galactokinase [Rathayibacter toxicus]PPG23212.1 galactokinase [Rathayibacter toxicus]PPG47796.1 galactokinase [Rathayibacter toxicus]PPH64670.1 galactokinase [Rathayibacter toxicus]
MTAAPASLAVVAERAASNFARTYGRPSAGVWAGPGRVNLIGEHTDYNDGFVFPFAIERGTAAAVAAREDRVIRIGSAFSPGIVEVSLDVLGPDALHGWSAYPLGVIWALTQHGVDLSTRSGFDAFIDSDVPIGVGLSSSAALMCAIAVALNELWELDLDRATLAQVGCRAENFAVGAPTGIMDEFASLCGKRDSAVFLDCRSLDTEVIPLGFEESGLVLLVIDTRVEHAHATGGYAERRTSCEVGAAALGVESLRELSVNDLPHVTQVLDEVTYRRVKHVVTENARVLSAVRTLRERGPRAIGELLDAGHASLRDDFEVSIPELDTAVDASRAAGAIGARMTGGGFGGSAIALTPFEKEEQVRAAVLSTFAEKGFATPELFLVTAADGAARVR